MQHAISEKQIGAKENSKKDIVPPGVNTSHLCELFTGT
jgi:hypothetical protein